MMNEAQTRGVRGAGIYGGGDGRWLDLSAAFGPILREAFPEASSIMRLNVAEALAEAAFERKGYLCGGEASDREPPVQTRLADVHSTGPLDKTPKLSNRARAVEDNDFAVSVADKIIPATADAETTAIQRQAYWHVAHRAALEARHRLNASPSRQDDKSDVEMARRICAQCSEGAGTINTPIASRFLAGELDNHPSMVACLAAISEMRATPSRENDKPPIEPIAYAPKGHIEKYLTKRHNACWVYSGPTADDNDKLYLHPAPLADNEETDALREALRECQDKLWIARCDTRDEAFKASATAACNMASAALAAFNNGGK